MRNVRQVNGSKIRHQLQKKKKKKKTDADSIINDTIVPADNVASEMPETDDISTQIEEVGCLFLTS